MDSFALSVCAHTATPALAVLVDALSPPLDCTTLDSPFELWCGPRFEVDAPTPAPSPGPLTGGCAELLFQAGPEEGAFGVGEAAAATVESTLFVGGRGRGVQRSSGGCPVVGCGSGWAGARAARAAESIAARVAPPLLWARLPWEGLEALRALCRWLGSPPAGAVVPSLGAADPAGEARH